MFWCVKDSTRAEACLIWELGVTNYATLRRDSLPEDRDGIGKFG
jgi:hypothetical protein